MDRPFETLIGILDTSRKIIVQAHDFPDHDAIASAFGLASLLRRSGINASITAGGSIGGISLSAMIERVAIDIEPFPDEAGTDEAGSAQVIVVDGSPANGTVARIAGDLVGVIDHHPASLTPDCFFKDIRVDSGSCASIIWSYWKESGQEPDVRAATALLAGIQLDTDFLSRRVSPLDLEAHHALFFLGDRELAREVVRTTLSVSQLPHIGEALSNCKIKGDVLVCEIGRDCASELLSVLADFLLRLREIAFVAVVEARGPEYRLSARTRDPRVDAGEVIRLALEGIGEGGGHRHMAGGILKPGLYPGGEGLLERIETEVTSQRRRHEADNQKG